MSYDLHVYAGKGLSPDDLRALVEAAGFGVDRSGGSESLTVTRGVGRTYSFTLELPQTVEPEDVPDEVTAVLLDASFFYELLVEGPPRWRRPTPLDSPVTWPWRRTARSWTNRRAKSGHAESYCRVL